MLISPPFLATRGTADTEDAWLEACMVSVNDGRFPVSFDLGWHGGMHLSAPMNGRTPLQVRAIADGKVVFVRAPIKVQNPTADHAQMYRGHWTDNGVVIIRHDTEIGEEGNGKVSFFSVYMHLSEIDDSIVFNRTTPRSIYRKAVIGNAGRIYGEQNRIHFEIISDDANLTKLVGRATGDLPLTANGRTDAVYGEMYFHVPAGSPIYVVNMVAAQKLVHSTRKAANKAQAIASKQGATAKEITDAQHAQVVATAAATAYTTAITAGAASPLVTPAMIVGLHYGNGRCTLSSYQLNGSDIGTPIATANYEYDLYTHATELYPACPSAGYELLRFGRILGPDALSPATAEHWRRVNYPGAQGWINLNAANVHKFSDADFPQWKKWKLVHDDRDTNSRCDSPTITAWLDTDHDGHVDPIEAASRLGDAAIQEKLKKTICKFPTEWETATIPARWDWLTKQSAENPHPMSVTDFGRLSAHITALCFWQDANLQTLAIAQQGTAPAVAATAISPNHWHFEPREFIRHFRKCGWLSPLELVQQLPANHPVGFNNMRDRLTLGYNSRAQTLPAGMQVALNKVSRKYLLETALRRAHFWGQIAQETDQLQTVREYASGADYEGRADLGNTQPGDGTRFRGRGVIQLTGRVNYARYGTYRGMNFTTDPNNLLIQNGAYAACDASTFYWVAEETRDKVSRTVNGVVKKKWILDGLIGISRRADIRTFGLLSEDAQITTDVSNVTKQVNRAQLHLDNRKRYFIYSYRLVSDSLETLQHANLRP